MTAVLPLCRVVLAAGLVAAPAMAQKPGTAAARREQLAKVQEDLADPDSMMRLAYMEEIIESGDGLRIQIAMRTAFASDDPELGALAFRAYLSIYKEFSFDVLLPPALQKVADGRAQSNSPDIDKQFPFLRALSNQAFRIRLIVKEYKFGSSGGIMSAYGTAPFNLTGNLFSAFVQTPEFGYCYFDISPTRRQTLEGTMACQGGWPKLAISTRAF